MIKKLLRSICADNSLIAATDKLAVGVSIIKFLARHLWFQRSMEIVLSNVPVRIRAESEREQNDEMFEKGFFAMGMDSTI